MKTTLVAAIFLITEVLLISSSPAQDRGNTLLGLQNPRNYGPPPCSTSFYPYCECYIYGNDRFLYCSIKNSQDFVEIKRILSTDTNTQKYGYVEFKMYDKIDIPEDVLGGKHVVSLYFYCLSRPLGEIDSNAFQSTSNYTTELEIQSCNLVDKSFSFLSQFPLLKSIEIYSSSINQLSNMAYLPALETVTIRSNTGFESWYLPYQTPNLKSISINTMPDIDDQKMDSILSSMTSDNYVYTKLESLNIIQNSLSRVPPIVFTFPALKDLYLYENVIETLTEGSINKVSSNVNPIYLGNVQLKTIEPGAFVGDFSSTRISLTYNPMESFPSSVFQNLLESMVDKSGFIDITGDPIADDCGLAWLLVDNRDLLPYVHGGAIANGTRFEDLNASEYSECF